jgi:hypothetical protein
MVATPSASLPATNAKRLRKGALAMKQSIVLHKGRMDCFAALAMTAEGFPSRLAASQKTQVQWHGTC